VLIHRGQRAALVYYKPLQETSAVVSADVSNKLRRNETVARGGHIRVGLEDAPLGIRSSNLELVEEAVRMVRDHGAEPASPTDMRQALGS
jgi:3-keto-5-aminohexanoate cleavage enzyme